MQWRLIADGAHSASWNMAMDDAILDAMSLGLGPPTVRLYTWDETAVTVGRHQDLSAGIDTVFCQSNSLPVVRRPTGGRGILHGTDLTVSVAMTLDRLPAGQASVTASYRYLSGGFVVALSSLGVDGAMGECDRAERPGGDCFAVRSRADVVAAAGQKVVGSAQRRSGCGLLQQSSIRWRRPDVNPSSVFRRSAEEGAYPLQKVPGKQLMSAVVEGFRALFGTDPEVTSAPYGWEEERAGVLIGSYAPLSL